MIKCCWGIASMWNSLCFYSIAWEARMTLNENRCLSKWREKWICRNSVKQRSISWRKVLFSLNCVYVPRWYLDDGSLHKSLNKKQRHLTFKSFFFVLHVAKKKKPQYIFTGSFNLIPPHPLAFFFNCSKSLFLCEHEVCRVRLFCIFVLATVQIIQTAHSPCGVYKHLIHP